MKPLFGIPFFRDIRSSILVLLGVVVVPLVLLQVGIEVAQIRDRRRHEVQTNLEVARAVAATFDAYVQDVLRQELMIGLAFAAPDPAARPLAAQLLPPAVREYPSLHDFVWAAVDGEILASSMPQALGMSLRDRDYFQAILGGRDWALSRLLPSPVSSRAVFVIARGIRAPSGELQGIVAGLVDPDRFGEVIQVERAQGGAITLYDHGGQAVYRFPEVIWTSALRGQTPRETVLREALEGREASGTYLAPDTEQERIFASVPVLDSGWVVVASRPEGEVMGPLWRGLWRNVLGIVVVAALALLGALRLSGRVARPIRELSEYAEQVGEGHREQRGAVVGPREVQSLARALDRMAEQLGTREAEQGRLLKEAQEAEQRAVAIQQRLATLVESISDGFLALDGEGRFTYVNNEAERLLRSSRDQLLGRSLWDAYPDARQTRFHEGYLEVVRTRQPRVVEDYFPPFEAWFEARAYPAEEGLSVLFQDVTERRRMEQQLRTAKEAAEALSQAKDEFLANVSHEIRTPMNAVIGLTDLVLQGPLAAEQRRFLDMVRSSAEALLVLINDVLDFSKMEAGQFEIVESPFSLRDTVERAVQSLSVRAHEKGLELVCRIPFQIPETFLGDAGRLRQILINLLDNAIKFTDRGSVTVAVAVRPAESETPGRWRVSVAVADTGIGIAAVDLDRLFRKFSQVDGSATRRHRGAGLGLAISQRLARMMGADIEVETREGAGSTFTLVGEFLAEPTSLSAVDHLQVPGGRALVVDDCEAQREALRVSLAELGFEVSTAEDGWVALEQLRRDFAAETPPHLIVLDSQMPGAGGFDVVQRLGLGRRKRPWTALMIPSTRIGEDLERCRTLGVETCWVKPLRTSDLVDTVRALVGGAPQPSPEQAGVSVPAPSYALGWASGARVLLAEDNPASRLLVQTLLEKCGCQVVAVENGREALDRVHREAFDLLLLDAQMPELDGYATSRELRRAEAADPERARLPVVCITAHALPADRARCIEAGMDDYLTKPVDGRALRQTVARHLGRSEPGSKAVPPAEPVPADLATALKRIQGDFDLFQELVKSYLQDFPARIEALREALAAGSGERAAKIAHTMKGALSMFAATHGTDLAVRLEHAGRAGELEAASQLLDEIEVESGRLADHLKAAVADGGEGLTA